MTADETFMALNNAFNIRGFPMKIYSDNGTNFVAASKLLKKFVRRNPMRSATTNLSWEFHPAHSPHMNGPVEKMVDLMKRAFRKLVPAITERHIKLSDTMFRYYLNRIIGILNDRPLCVSSTETTGLSILTPNYFLLGRPLRDIPIEWSPVEETTLEETLPSQIAHVEHLSQILWKN
jgi:hypothetical protein